MPADPLNSTILGLAVILVAAKLGGHLATRFRQPAVLGELIAGVLLGNLSLLGFDGLSFIATDAGLDLVARLGVLILLFEVGLESTVREMLQVGLSAFLVAVLGVVMPFVLGWWVGALLLPQHSSYVHAFLGATLTATSVGITARVLKDMGKSKTPEARIILGAAVIDDVLGLIILAVVGGLIAAAGSGQPWSSGGIALILGKAGLFLFGALALGASLSPRVFAIASRLHGRGVLLGIALAFCFALAWLADRVGLAPIVGAYAAGLVLERAHFQRFAERNELELEELVAALSSFLVPVFFVLMGMRVQLAVFTDPGVLLLAAALTLAAILGKQVCSFGALGRGLDRLSIGLGMVPRGEVGLIFANVGLGLTLAGERVIDPASYSAVVIMVIVTTLVTPPALAWSLGRKRREL